MGICRQRLRFLDATHVSRHGAGWPALLFGEPFAREFESLMTELGLPKPLADFGRCQALSE